jgi:hypothetical protein
MLVQASSPGFYAGVWRDKGASFNLADKSDYSEKWMVKLGAASGGLTKAEKAAATKAANKAVKDAEAIAAKEAAEAKEAEEAAEAARKAASAAPGS